MAMAEPEYATQVSEQPEYATQVSQQVYPEAKDVLAQEYLDFAFNLYCSCTIWGIAEQDMMEVGRPEHVKHKRQLLGFLTKVFAKAIVDRVDCNLEALSHSKLGLEFTFRRSEAHIGRAIISGTLEEAGEREVTDDEITDYPNDVPGVAEIGRGAGRGRGAGAGAGTSAGAGAGDKNPRLAVLEKHNTRWLFLAQKRNAFLVLRSGEFASKVGHRPTSLYRPVTSNSVTSNSVTCMVSLYHGTRVSSLRRFAATGIPPVHTYPNEFHMDAAFYVFNSVQFAYEFPLHYHISRGVSDDVAVLEFRVDLEILHGNKSPDVDSPPFQVKWFRRPNAEWKKFCATHICGAHLLPPNAKFRRGLGRKTHSYDIVIGPVCKGLDSDGGIEAVEMTLPGKVHLTQVALCSERAKKWLEDGFATVFRGWEQRSTK